MKYRIKQVELKTDGKRLESFLCDRGLKKAWFLAYEKK